MATGGLYEIERKWARVLSYWFAQWVLVCLAAVALVSLEDGITASGVASVSIAATVWVVLICISQRAFAAEADKLGGDREVGWWRKTASRLTASLLATVLCLHVVWAILTVVVVVADHFEGDTFYRVFWLVTCVCIVVGLLGWSRALNRFLATGPREKQYTKLARRLLAGTGMCAACCVGLGVLGMVLSGESDVPIFIAVYCIPVVGGGAIAMLGCMLYLSRLARARAPWYAIHCEACGYDMRGNGDAERCPECGEGWKAARGSAIEGPVQGPLRSV